MSDIHQLKTVSIAMATYNGEAYLRQQIDSLLGQRYNAIKEIIISDDASTDGTKRILSEYVCKHPDLITLVENEENIGYIKNFEKAISRCTSEFIALCDQDDIWYPEKISELLARIGNRDLIHSDARLIDASGHLISHSFSNYSKETLHGFDFLYLCINNLVTGCTLLFRRSLLNRAIPFPRCIPHDHWLALLAHDGKGIAYCPRALISYRQHGKNALGAKPTHDIPKQRYRRTFQEYLKFQEAYHRRRFKRYSQLLFVARNKFSSINYRRLSMLKDFYRSFFSQRIRLRAFFFFIAHYKDMTAKKSFLQGISRLVMSVFGIKKA